MYVFYNMYIKLDEDKSVSLEEVTNLECLNWESQKLCNKDLCVCIYWLTQRTLLDSTFFPASTGTLQPDVADHRGGGLHMDGELQLRGKAQ